ncbi:MAG: thioesterase [Christensenellaceae bacterium]|nr:thioesterase [Christensenellaceae bacterium]MEA5067928.1 thioesterase [Christensenellaceae bacterium]
MKGLFFERGFRFEDTAGALIGEAITTWVLLDIEKRRVLRPSVLKMPAPINTELDMNGHMNNARYTDWALDPLRSLGEARY